MRVVFFGSYDASVQPRVQVLLEGFREAGDQVLEANIPLPLDSAARVRLVRQPWRAPALALGIAGVWPRLWRQARRLASPDAVVVGYMGHFDVHLARRLWPDTPLALDFLFSGADTARDRGVRSRPLLRLLDRLDRAAIATADVPFVDTEEHRERLPVAARQKAVVVPVGAPRVAFESEPRLTRQAGAGGPLRVIFFGTFAPLQGTLTIARAAAQLEGQPIELLMVGRGQDHAAARQLTAPNPRVEWADWLDPGPLTARAAESHVCLGIFGTGPKALRVVPQKVFHGAAAGCAIVTSDTLPQRRALGDAAVFVPPGDAEALAATLASLAREPDRVASLRQAAATRAREDFTPEAVVRPLREHLLGRDPQ